MKACCHVYAAGYACDCAEPWKESDPDARPMTKTQRRVLADIAARGTIPGDELRAATRSALLGHGLIEECPRMYFGPRTWRYRLTAYGREVAAKQVLAPTRFDRDVDV